jgi:hypothetical protein
MQFLGVFKGLSKIVVIAVVAIIAYLFYLYASFIDETVLSGEGYGFTVGISKEEAYSKAKDKFKDKEVFIIYPRNSQGVGPFKQLTFDENDKLILSKMDSWKVYYEKNVWDSIELTFTDSKLFSIYRRRQKFELP